MKRSVCFNVLSVVLIFALLVALLPMASVGAAPVASPMLAVGGAHTVALKSDGTVWTWGWSDCGQLGDVKTDVVTDNYMGIKTTVPLRVQSLSGIVAIAVGDGHTLALKNDGTVWAFGLNNCGQLGDGGNSNRAIPMKVSGLTGVTAIAASVSHSVALKGDGTVWTWGSNNAGQLGDGTTERRLTPVKVQDLSGVTAIAANYFLTIALKNDGTVWACGANNDAQLGDGTTINRSTPVKVQNLSGITAIEANVNHHCVALKNDGTVWTWGFNESGQLGDGTTASKMTPIQVPGLSGIAAISAGHSYTMALKNDATAWAWGRNNYAQLGIDSSEVRQTTPAKIQHTGDIAGIAAGSASSAIFESDGDVWTWGSNASGQLGNGTIIDSMIPVRVKDGAGYLNLYTDSVYKVTVSSGTGGGNYKPGDVVTIKANTAPSGQKFKKWNITPTVAFTQSTSALTATAKFTMPAQDITVTAVYEALPAPTKSQFTYSLSAKTYNGKAQGISVTPKTGVGKVTAIYYAGSKTVPAKAGSYAITLDVALGTQYRAVSKLSLGTYTISRADLSKVSTSISDIAWTGAQIKPTSFKYNGISFAVSTNATAISYGTNKYIGKGTIKITGKGNFTGTKTITFKIVPRSNYVSSITVGTKQMKVYWSKVSSAQKITRYQVHYRVKGASTWTTKTYSSGYSSATISSLVKGKQYEVQVRSYKTISGINYCSCWSITKTSGKIK